MQIPDFSDCAWQVIRYGYDVYRFGLALFPDGLSRLGGTTVGTGVRVYLTMKFLAWKERR